MQSVHKQVTFLLTLWLILSFQPSGVSSQTQANASSRKTYQFINGQWFDGRSFQRRTFYSVDGVLTRRRPQRVDEVIDLENGYVVPPFGDAHSHHFDGAFNIRQLTEMYLRDGIFYAKIPGNVRTGARQVAALVNTPTTVDVIYAHGVLTGNYSHPIATYEQLALGFYTPAQWEANAARIRESRLRENDAYYIIDTQADLESKWARILAGRPDFIKVMVLDSENYEERRRRNGYGEGIDPQLLPQIVARAHATGLRVTAHVDSAFDYHIALMAGVDEMAHMPGYEFRENADVRTYEISPEDARATARRQVVVIPTANRMADSTNNVFNITHEHRERIRTVQIRNLRLLKRYGVRFAIGTDLYGTDALKEALYLSTLGVFSNLKMLKMWCEDTPRVIFPNRRIGRLREGHEASFIVLSGNPVENFENVRNIRLRFKQGNLLHVAR